MWFSGRKGSSWFTGWSTAEEVTQGIDATGLTAIVTGASSGIGAETTRVLVLRGVHVIMAVRNLDSGRNVKAAIIEQIPNAKVDVMELDLSSVASVRKFASEYTSLGLPLNLLINNAGCLAPEFSLSQDGIEVLFATNHLGHFLLTNLLLENMKRTARACHREGRIVNVASELHKLVYSGGIRFDKINDSSSYKSWLAYGQSKLANILHANELARLLKEEGVNVTANSLHPGAVATGIFRNSKFVRGLVNWVGKFFLKTIPQGAATQCYLALHPQVNGVSGEYFSNCNIAFRTALAGDEELAKKLWEFSLIMTQTK